MMGNPIGTMQDLIMKTGSCRRRAEFWKAQFSGPLICFSSGKRKSFQQFKDTEKFWKAFALIIDSFDEWGSTTGDDACKMLLGKL